MNTYLIYGHDNKLLCEVKAANMSYSCRCYCFTDDSYEDLQMYLGANLVHHIIKIDSMGHIYNDIAIPFPEVLE